MHWAHFLHYARFSKLGEPPNVVHWRETRLFLHEEQQQKQWVFESLLPINKHMNCWRNGYAIAFGVVQRLGIGSIGGGCRYTM